MEDQAENLREIMRKQASLQEQEKLVKSKEIKRARIITVTSGKGGVGKTNIAVNIAIAYARMGKRVTVMDADLGMGNVHVILNFIPKFSLYHVMRRQKTMKEILTETEYGISIVACASGISELANLSPDERQNFINEIDSLTNTDIIIIDTSAGVSNNVLDFITVADDAIIIATPDPTSITDAYGVVKIIATKYDSLNIDIKLVVNQVKSAASAKKIADRMTHIAGQFLNLKMEYLGFIYEDMTVANAVHELKPFMVTNPKCKASLCIQHIVERMEKTDIAPEGGLSNMFKKFFN